jgi:hypothetical protein
MTAQERLQEILPKLPEARQHMVCEFAAFLLWQEQLTHEEFREWIQHGKRKHDQAYGPNEPVYTRAHVKRDLRS